MPGIDGRHGTVALIDRLHHGICLHDAGRNDPVRRPRQTRHIMYFTSSFDRANDLRKDMGRAKYQVSVPPSQRRLRSDSRDENLGLIGLEQDGSDSRKQCYLTILVDDTRGDAAPSGADGRCNINASSGEAVVMAPPRECIARASPRA